MVPIISSTPSSAPSAPEVRSALERVLVSQHFINTKRLRHFLRYVVEESLDDRASALKGYTIGIAVYERAANFDAEADTIVRVQAGQLRRRLALYYADEGAHDLIKISLPKGSYAPLFTPQEIKSDELSESKYRGTINKGPSIAVLPFDDLSTDKKFRHVAKGLAEDITMKLTRFKELVVTTHHPLSEERGNEPITAIAERLGVDFFLMGNFQHDGNRIRLNVKLIDALSQSVLFAEQFERTLTDGLLFELQDEIAARIAGALSNPYGIISTTICARACAYPQHADLSAYEVVQRGLRFNLLPTRKEYDARHKELESVLKAQPTYASAWAAMGFIRLQALRWNFTNQAHEELFPGIVEAANKAVLLDPNDAHGYHLQFLVNFHMNDRRAFERAARHGFELNPYQPAALADYGFMVGISGQWDLGHHYINRAISLSVKTPYWFRTLKTWHLYDEGAYEKAALGLHRQGDVPILWYTALSIAINQALGDKAVVKEHAVILRQRYPLFEQNISEQLKIWHIVPSLQEKFCNDLKAADCLS